MSITEKELAAIKERMINSKEIKRNIDDFVLKGLDDYCKKYEDDPDRIISRASEILINRYTYELNLIITQICSGLSGEPAEAELKIISDFNDKWVRKHGLKL